jgi:hypothetical protein
MSVIIRKVWILLPASLLAAWLAVRARGTSSQPALDDPPTPMTVATRGELRDPSLAQLIARLAEQARTQHLAQR